MEIGISAARSRLSALIAAAQRGERVFITKRGEPAVELVACPEPQEKPKGDFFSRLKAARKRLGVKDVPLEEARKLIAEFDDPAFSREVLGLGDDWEPYVRDDAVGRWPSRSRDGEA